MNSVLRFTSLWNVLKNSDKYIPIRFFRAFTPKLCCCDNYDVCLKVIREEKFTQKKSARSINKSFDCHGVYLTYFAFLVFCHVSLAVSPIDCE